MKNKKKYSKEPQYNDQFQTINEKGSIELGPTASHLWRNDPRHLCFLLSRYKFCSKLLAGKKNVLEIGCGEGFGTRIVLQTVEHIHGIDFDPLFIKYAKRQYSDEDYNCSFSVVDITNNMPKKNSFDGAFALDFIEHIQPELEHNVLNNIRKVLSKNAVCIIGTPNINAHKYASPESVTGHINLKDADSLKKLLDNYFYNVFIFSMNDEVVHTGYYPMAHYLMAVGVGCKKI